MSTENAGGGRRFHLIELVGQGTYGAVYLAEQQSGAGFRKKVALKLLNEEVARVKGAARRMRDEARVLGLLSHRHIVAVLDLVQVDDRWAILMEWVPGADLEHVVHALHAIEATVPVSAALEAGAAICDALDFAANAPNGVGGMLGVIHRDIKPGNVRLTVDGEIKVLDFGGARFSLTGRESATRSGAWIGTERYMGPERLLRESDTGAGDVYATGATLVELILARPLGRTPIEPVRHLELVEEALELVRSRIEAEPEVVDRVVAALRSALAHDPTLRQTPRELGTELEALARRVTGPSLQQFAREFVSRVDGLLGRLPELANGTLLEGASELDVSDGPAEIPPVYGEPGYDRGPGRALPILTLTALAAAAFAALVVGVAAVAVGGEIASWSASSEEATSADRVAVAPPPEEPPPTVRAAAPDIEPPAPSPVDVVFHEFPTEGALLPVIVEPAPARRARGPSRPEARPAPAEVAREPARLIDRTVVALKDASRLTVTCRDVTATGTASVRIMDFPAGSCTVEAEWLGAAYVTRITVEQADSFLCQVQDGTLLCS